MNQVWVGGMPGNDDAMYATGALDMLDAHDWSTPRFNGDPVFSTAPPMWYWILATSFRVLGPTDFAAKFAGGLATTAAGLIVFLVAFRFFRSLTVAALAGAAFNLDPFVIKYGPHALAHTAWAGTAALALLALYEARVRASLRAYLAFAVLSAASILFKSALGCFPLLIGGAWLLWDRAGLKTWARFLGACVLAVALGGCWYWLEWRRFGDDFLREHLRDQLFRYAFNFKAVHQTSPWAHLAIVLRRGAASSLILLPPVLWALWKRRDRESRLVAAWILVPVLGLGSTARFETRYMAPVLAGMAIGIGLWLGSALRERTRQNVLAALYAAGLLWIVATTIFPIPKGRDSLAETRPLLATLRDSVPEGERWLLIVSPEAPIDPKWPNRVLEYFELQGPINRGALQQMLFYTRRRFQPIHEPDLDGWKGKERLVFADDRRLDGARHPRLKPLLRGPDWTLYRR